MNELSVKEYSEQKSVERQTPFALAAAVSFCSFAIAYYAIAMDKFGEVAQGSFLLIISHGPFFGVVAPEAMGSAFGLPLIHLAIAMFFKSQRNPSSRRRIFIGWGLFHILLETFTLLK